VFIIFHSGALYPQPEQNTMLLMKTCKSLLPAHQIRFFSFAKASYQATLPSACFGFPVYWCLDLRRDWRRRLLYPALSKLFDRRGYSDYLSAKLATDELQIAIKRNPPDAVVSTIEPFYAADAVSRTKGMKRILYLMDPPAELSNGHSTKYRIRRLKKILATQDAILTTPFIRDALISHGYVNSSKKLFIVGFPLIEQQAVVPNAVSDRQQIHLLFCGWLYADIRSPRYFLDILSRLDERFVVTFMGRECENLTERFEIHTKARLITLPQQPYDAAQQAMADADIMINIGNSVPVHMPSKTLEYINTGKPFVNFYKMEDCPTLYYTKRYPLCLNLSEQDPDIDAATERFTAFCLESKGKTVDRTDIEREYADCTPRYIAQKILDALGE